MNKRQAVKTVRAMWGKRLPTRGALLRACARLSSAAGRDGDDARLVLRAAGR